MMTYRLQGMIGFANDKWSMKDKIRVLFLLNVISTNPHSSIESNERKTFRNTYISTYIRT